MSMIETLLKNLTPFPTPSPLSVPLTQPTLTVVPDLPDISEGDRLYLICGVKGTPPVTFKWYHAGSVLYTTTSTGNNSYYQIPWLSKEHSGTYFCEAINYANNVVRSDQVTIEGETFAQ